MHYKIKIILFLAFCVFSNLQAQFYINSPYTRFGFGDINRIGFGQNRGMGGISAGYRVHNTINYLNPASYTSLDTLSFVFDIGLLGNIIKLESKTDQNKTKTAYFDHVAILFPATNWLAFSTGIVPYSKVGYDLKSTTTDEFKETIQEEYAGNGGLNQFYIGTSLKIKKHLALGVNFSYLFGPISRSTIVSFPSDLYSGITVFNYRTNVRNVVWNFGMQYFTAVGAKGSLVLGAEFDNKTNLNSNYIGLITREQAYASADTLSYEFDRNRQILMPARLDLGFTYCYDQRLMVGLDYSTQNWSKSNFFDTGDTVLKRESTIRFGVEYNPVPLTVNRHVNYLGRLKYRIGGFYSLTPLEIRQTQIKSYGLSFGIGLPWKDERKLFTRTMFNINYELIFRGTLENQLIKETQQYISIGITLHDFWFFKPKYD